MLARVYRLVKDKDIEQVFKYGKYYNCDFLNLKKIATNKKNTRFGFVVSLKISKKAVKRNKIKRQLRNIIQKEKNNIKNSFDVIILPKPQIIDKRYKDIEQVLLKLLKKAEII